MNSSSTSTLDVPAISGGLIVREVVRFAFFVRRPHRDIADAVVQAVGRVVDLFPPPALSMFAAASGDWLDFDTDGLKAQVHKRLAGKDKSINGSASLSGNQANIADVALDYAGLALDRPVFRDGSCVLTVFVAVSAFGSNLTSSQTLAEQLVFDLDCQAAYVDLALVGDQARRQAMARRYQCLDISDPRIVARDIEDRLPCVFWKNFLNSSLMAALGGRSALQSALLHVPRKVTYFEPDNDLDKRNAQEQWHLRYVNHWKDTKGTDLFLKPLK